ncbi:AAA family ATPase [Stenotrophomonas sp.]|uniref:AAA family ATPase n=1 Tax=Stenotrophomonas sp. TaxID=69392 RepID=UPI0028AF9A59|nr:AAA family ATPase [Stenotrophomonas sp.]
MRLKTISIWNFRLLRRLTVNLANEDTTTILVGPNNSGKTSVMGALRLFTKPRTPGGVAAPKKTGISSHRLSQIRHRDFKRIEAALLATVESEQKYAIPRRLAPRMRMDLTFSYDAAF